MCWAVCCLLWFMLPIFMTQKAGYLLRNEGMGGIRLSKSSVQMLDIVALLLRMRRVNSALTLIFRKKSNLINGKSSLGDGWSNVPSPGSTIPDVSAKIMRFPSHLLRPWLKSPISIPYSSAYEYSFLEFLLPVTPGQAGTPPAKSSIEFGFLRIRLVLLRISTQIVKEQSVHSGH